MTKPNLTQARLKELFYYKADTGQLIRRIPVSNNTKKDDIAGNIDLYHGYHKIMVDRSSYRAHRLIWLYAHGEWPSHQIDHINGDRSDNRLENLRCVTNTENCKNQMKKSNNTSGVVGVSWRKREGTWCAYITINGVQTGLGYYDNLFDAVCARKSAEIRYKYHENHGR